MIRKELGRGLERRVGVPRILSKKMKEVLALSKFNLSSVGPYECGPLERLVLWTRATKKGLTGSGPKA